MTAHTPPALSPELVDRLLTMVSGNLHDRPVQALVAARLMVESATVDPSNAAPMLQRGLASASRAAELARDLMWALDRTPPDLTDPAEGVAEALGRAGPPGAGILVTVDVADVPALQRLPVMVAAVHDVLSGALLAGGHGRTVELTADATTLRALVAIDGAPRPGKDDPWLAMAAARLPRGRVLVLPAGEDLTTHTVALSAPLALGTSS